MVDVPRLRTESVISPHALLLQFQALQPGAAHPDDSSVPQGTTQCSTIIYGELTCSSRQSEDENNNNPYE